MQADYVTVVEDKPITSAKYSLPVIFDQNCSCSSCTVSVQQLSFLLMCVVGCSVILLNRSFYGIDHVVLL